MPRQLGTAAPAPRRKRPSTAGSGLLPRFVASLLAEHHEVADLTVTVFDRREWERLDELRACLFQELVLRGVDIDTFPALRSWPLVRAGWHPLAWLPVHRRDLEAGADFPSRSICGCASGVPSRLPDEGRTSPPAPRTTRRFALRDIVTTDIYESIVAAVQAGEWGDCGAWAFMLDETIAPERVPAVLPALPMACVDGLGPADRFAIAIRPVDEIWRLLFAAAAMGGMGTPGVQGAYGRLWAWRSMAGLSGAAEGASADKVERHARQSTWFHFEADTDWFHNDIDADYGIAALSPNCRRIAVPAATDTDWRYSRTGSLPPDTHWAEGAEGDGDGASARADAQTSRRMFRLDVSGERSGLAFGWTMPRARVPEGATGGVTGETWPGTAASGGGLSEDGALRGRSKARAAPGGSVHVSGISARARPEPVRPHCTRQDATKGSVGVHWLIIRRLVGYYAVIAERASLGSSAITSLPN
ncbi:DUF6183 family protein [Streptomyces mirabilis]|uniref:DUF6183 family protein n=1 Tax=Streptomyces mirabilis TaxID=68239 RepID=UPI0033FFEB26